MGSINQLFGLQPGFSTQLMPQSSDIIILVLPKINPSSDPSLQPDKFKVNRKEYLCICALAKKPNEISKKMSICWIYGKKLLHKADGQKVYYCYLCEKQKKKQQFVVINGNSTALNHLWNDHFIDKDGNSIKQNNDPCQLSLPKQKEIYSLVYVCKFNKFKELLIQ